MLPRFLRVRVRAIFAVVALALAGCADGEGGGGGGADSGGTDDDTAHGSGSGGSAPFDCAGQCMEMGFEGGTDDAGACVCGEPLDEECFVGTAAVCACDASINQPCSDQDAFSYYARCYQDIGAIRELLTCVGGFVEDSEIDCEAAKEGCT
jgi:hypothetical protein